MRRSSTSTALCIGLASGAFASPAIATTPRPGTGPGCARFLADQGIDTDEFLRSALDSMAAHVAILDDTGRIIAINRSWIEFGRANGLASADSALGTSYPAVCDRSAARYGASEGAGVARWIRATLGGGREDFELVYPCHSPEARTWFHLHGSSFESKGKRFLIVAHYDITRRMVLAEEVLALGRAQAVAGILSGFAHDMNNVLTVIAGHASLAQGLAPAGALRDHVSALAEGADRAAAMVQRLSQMAPRPDRSVTPIAAKGAVEHVLATIAGIPANVTLVRDLSSSVGDIRISQVDLHLVLNELIKNALASLPSAGGEIRIALERGTYPPASLPSGLAHSATGYLRIVVTDNGRGISAQQVPRLFDPFFRRNALDARVGLGLAVVGSVVTGAGGGVSVETLVGRGTAISLYFPALPPAGAGGAPPAMMTGATAPAQTERWILLVDDNAAVLAVTKMGLESMGLRVRAAGSVAEAKTLLTGEISLVMTDYAMPDGGGFALAAYVHQHSPRVPVIVYSGEADHLTRPQTVTALVGKPFRLPELNTLIDRLLSRSSAPPSGG